MSRMGESEQIVVLTVPLPAQGHLNQLLQVSCLISSYNIPVHYVASAIHIRQAKARANGLDPQEVARIRFQEIYAPAFASPPPDPNSSYNFPTQLQPVFFSTLGMREPFAAYVQEMAKQFKRVVVLHDMMMSVVVQDVSLIPNAESYTMNCLSALSLAQFTSKRMENLSFPGMEHLTGLPSLEGCVPHDMKCFAALQYEAFKHRSGDLYNTCRLLEGPYLKILESEENAGDRKSWAIGPILPVKPSSLPKRQRHMCLDWLDKHEPKSVICVIFGTSISLVDEDIKELAMGLEQSKVKFLWVLRDADKGNIFDGEVRRAKLPDGFEERVEGRGLVVQDWAPQVEILAHSSTGGFMSHCGWNSCIESITMGVPMVAWPMHSDQPANAALVTGILKTGLLGRQWSPAKEPVKSSTIESVVRRLMASEEGDGIRKRAEEFAITVRKATQHGGASRLELDSFIVHITRS